MKRVLALPAVVLLLGSVACSSPEVVAEASYLQESTGERIALQDLPIQLLPYDRDAIFDSLEAAAASPEPPIPPELLAQRQQVRQAQEAHAQAEARWAAVRDSLRQLSERTQQLQAQGLRATPQYRAAFEAFARLEDEEAAVRQESEEAFARFTDLQEATIARIDSVRVAQETWAEEAFRDFDTIIEAKLLESGVEPAADTTNAAGAAVFRVPEGQWWVYGRYTLPYEELYWNEPIEVTGDSTSIQLTEENAELRPVL